MLTKDLVQFKTHKGTITPEFIDPADKELLTAAEQLLDVFKAAEGQSRSQLQESAQIVIENTHCQEIAVRGLYKLLLDRTEFDTAPDEALIRFRETLFQQTSTWLSSKKFSDLQEYYQCLQEHYPLSPATLAQRLYSDLPAHQPVTQFKSLSPERLLQRYNCAQVQGLLIRSHQLDIKITDSQAESLRQLFKYLRFHQLLANIRKSGPATYHIVVDGPLTLFYQTQKYGLNLAFFFPALLHQEKWELTARIQFKNQRTYQLSLDDSCGIQPYSHHFLAYIPEEIRLFQQMFHQKVKEWEISPANDFVPLEGEYYCFPDYELIHQSGVNIALELFHPWHASHLLARLQALETITPPPLLLGISKTLLNDSLISQSIKASNYFSSYGFVFRKMPTLDKLNPLLKKLLT